MFNVGSLLKLVLPQHLDWIGDITNDVIEIALATSDGWSEEDEKLVADKVRTILEHKGFDPADAESVAKASVIIAREIAIAICLQIARAKVAKKKHKLLINRGLSR